MDFETIRWIAVISLIANIISIYFISTLYQNSKMLLLGGLWGIEKTAGNMPKIDKENVVKYTNFCHKNYTTHVVPILSKERLK